MVVQDVEDSPMAEPITKKPKKYVVIKNHVRELLPDDEGLSLVSCNSNTSEKPNTVKRESLKRKKESQTHLASASKATDVSESDLEELKTVYRKCKSVLQKIETKYGHLLDLESNESVESYQNFSSAYTSCQCSGKKKIVFDEYGQKIEKDCCMKKHICLKRVKRSHSDSHLHKASIQIEYDNVQSLPNDLQELENVLKDDTISKSYRHMVIDKIYLLRQSYLNEVRYEKQDIIKQLKENPDEVLEFKGTNLSSLEGYPIKAVTKTNESTV